MQRKPSLFGLTYPLLLCCIFSGCGAGKEPQVGGGSSSSAGVTPQSCSSPELPVTPLRRLTRFEYEHTVRDLLNVDTAAVQQIPADEADGFDNNAELQVAPDYLVEKYVLVSEALAAEAVKNLAALTDCNATFTGGEVCARRFAQSFGRRAFRRPITAADETMFMAAYDAGARGGSHQEGIEVMIRMALQSPDFLYRLEFVPPTAGAQQLLPFSPYELATRLSYLIWGAGPDDALLDAAAAGQLSTKAQVAAKAREMLSSPKAQDSLNNFLAQWAGLRKLDITTKNTSLFPNYSTELRDAMKRELPAFVSYMFDRGDVTLSNLLTSEVAFVSGPLAGIYGVAAPVGSANTPKMVNLPGNQGRAGLLTQAGFLSVQGHPDQTSAVLRGKFVRAKLLCDPPPPPPDDVDISVPEITEGATARDRAAIHLSAGGNCSACHTLMDPIGLSFENFDAMGQYRLTENGVTIDVSGEVLYSDDPALEGEFVGVRQLAEKLANSDLVQDCMATQMFRFASGRFEGQGDACSLTTLQDSFAAADGDLVELIVAMTQTDTFFFRNQGAQ